MGLKAEKRGVQKSVSEINICKDAIQASSSRALFLIEEHSRTETILSVMENLHLGDFWFFVPQSVVKKFSLGTKKNSPGFLMVAMARCSSDVGDDCSEVHSSQDFII